MQCRGFDPPLRRFFRGEGIFPLELTWVLTSFPPNPFGLDYKLRSSLCTHGVRGGGGGEEKESKTCCDSLLLSESLELFMQIVGEGGGGVVP